MTEFEQQLLQHLQKQADQLTALALSQSQTTKQLSEQATAIGALSNHQEVTSSQLLRLQTSLKEIHEALSKEPSGESLEATLRAALQPLENSLEVLIESFNKLGSFSAQLLKQLPPLPAK